MESARFESARPRRAHQVEDFDAPEDCAHVGAFSGKLETLHTSTHRYGPQRRELTGWEAQLCSQRPCAN